MGPPPFSAQVDLRVDAVKIDVCGELDMATVPLLEDLLARLDDDDVKPILLDLNDVTFLDATAMHAFIAARERALAKGGRFILVRPSAAVRKLVGLTGTQYLLDEEEAGQRGGATRT